MKKSKITKNLKSDVDWMHCKVANEDMLLVFDWDCLNLSVYNPSEKTHDLFMQIAFSEGLFWSLSEQIRDEREKMLSRPVHGWSDFQLEGTSVYGLSYLDDIAFEWMDQAIRGLETMLPFCVKGFLEPNRFLCTVSYWNCHIICEDDERYPLEEDDVTNER